MILPFFAQGKPDGTCWKDANGNELESGGVLGEIDLYDDGAAPTLAAELNPKSVWQVGEDEALRSICQYQAPQEGINSVAFSGKMLEARFGKGMFLLHSFVTKRF